MVGEQSAERQRCCNENQRTCEDISGSYRVTGKGKGMIVNVVQVRYDPKVQMCEEWLVHTEITDEQGMQILKAETAPMYMYPAIQATMDIAVDEVWNNKCRTEKKKEHGT
jgi:hypothetical protein